jgi:CBS domain-containing protein
VLNFVIPRYVQDQPGLARAFDEQASDRLCRKLAQHTVRELLPRPADVDELPAVDADATTIEIAAVMAKVHSPLVAVVDAGHVLGAITVSRLLTYLLPA